MRPHKKILSTFCLNGLIKKKKVIEDLPSYSFAVVKNLDRGKLLYFIYGDREMQDSEKTTHMQTRNTLVSVIYMLGFLILIAFEVLHFCMLLSTSICDAVFYTLALDLAYGDTDQCDPATVGQ